MKVGGYLLLLTSLAVGTYAYQPQSFDSVMPDLSSIKATPAKVSEASLERKRVFTIAAPPANSPTLRSLSDRASARMGRATTDTAQLDAVALPVVRTAPAQQSANPGLAETIQAVEKSDDASVKGNLTSVLPADDKSRARLVRNLQRELRRVGCLSGSIDGEWDAVDRRAMEAFMDRVNATLPSHQPDYVLLTLVRNHKSAVCGETCPKGQSLSGDGRCMPNAIVAKELRRSQPRVTVAEAPPAPKTPFKTTLVVAETPAAARRDAAPLPGRMAMGAPGSTSDGEKSWWESLMGASDKAPEAKQQTLEAPVGLTHVPTARVTKPAAKAGSELITTASVEPTALQGSQNGASAGNDGFENRPRLTDSVRPRRAAPSRRVRREASRPSRRAAPPRYARRWTGRNVQSMFVHPLGRM